MNNLSSNRSVEIMKEFFNNRDHVATIIRERDNCFIDTLKLLDLLDRIRQNWKDENQKNESLRDQLLAAEQESGNLKKENRLYKEQLRDARAQIAALMSEKQSMELDISEMERKFQFVSQLLKDDMTDEEKEKLAFLKNPKCSQKKKIESRRATGASAEFIDYDKSGDSVETCEELEMSHLRNGKIYRRSHLNGANNDETKVPRPTKRSKSKIYVSNVPEEVSTPCKRSRNSRELNKENVTTVDPHAKRHSRPKVTARHSINRSLSESNVLNANEIKEAEQKFNALTPRSIAKSQIDIRSPYAQGKSWINVGGTINSRPHSFISYNTVLPEKCDVCNRHIALSALTAKPACKCTDCGVRLHVACKEHAPMPCIPRTPTSRTPSKQRPRLKDFCPPTRPMIPSIIIHCVVALERDRLNCEGIYRIPGQESQVTKLLNDLKNSRVSPKLENHYTETITGCIKKFLKELRDPVIPTSSWEEFVRAADTNDIEALNNFIMDLPIPNRDTLAYLCSHFQKICENSSRNKMTAKVLARSVAPTIVGHAPPRSMNFAQGNEEAKKQVNVMLALLQMPPGYWTNFYESNEPSRPFHSNHQANTPISSSRPVFERTPGRTPLAPIISLPGDTSILGPLGTPPASSSKLLHHVSRRGNMFENLF
ncbi:unnamed protein product [Dracunculus medinensis]|uniref:Rac GTPase-activating protein 1 n=1 Tax=Dracunculus medinensis TaxID=318479 RepID=A0A158Q3G9_DRAME|nr:unnamed protein product [Dracunculus medinensis]